jgi:hypothetical protein
MNVLLILFIFFASVDFAKALDAQSEVDILIVLAVDVSDSIDDDEYKLQKTGIVGALKDKNLKMILEQCNELGVGITYMEWSGHHNMPNQSAQMVPWTRLKNGRDLELFAQQIQQASRLTRASTDVELSLLASEELLEKKSPFSSENKVILVSGDGTANTTSRNSMTGIMPLEQVQEILDRSLVTTSQRLIAKGYTIHALVIANVVENTRTISLEEYFEKYVIGGPGAFTRSIQNFEDYTIGLLDILVHTLNKCVS